MNIKPHSQEEIVETAKKKLANKTTPNLNKIMILVKLLHESDGVIYGYEVHFKRHNLTDGNSEWKFHFIRNSTSP